MFKITIQQYDAMLQSMIDNLNLRDYDYDNSYDQIQSIDMNFDIVETNENMITHIIVHNIESLYDALNDAIETIRANRYVALKYETTQFTLLNDDDENYVVEFDDKRDNETFNVEMIDEFEKNNL